MFGEVHIAMYDKDEFAELAVGARIWGVESLETGECAFEGQREHQNGGRHRRVAASERFAGPEQVGDQGLHHREGRVQEGVDEVEEHAPAGH